LCVVIWQLDLTNEEVQLEGLEEELAMWGDHEVVRAILSKVGLSPSLHHRIDPIRSQQLLCFPSTRGVRVCEDGASEDGSGRALARVCDVYSPP